MSETKLDYGEGVEPEDKWATDSGQEESSELKPCPFCGGKNIEKQSIAEFHWMHCGDCSAYGSWVHWNEDEKLAWNTRPIEEELTQKNQRLIAFASGRGMVSEADGMTEVAVLVCGLHDTIDTLRARIAELEHPHVETGDWASKQHNQWTETETMG